LCIDTTCTIIGDFIVEYLSEFEAEFKKVLGHESGAQGRFFDEKTEGIKFRYTVPLNTRKSIQSAGSYQTIVLSVVYSKFGVKITKLRTLNDTKLCEIKL
jgi:hypothetical protein